MEAGFVFEFAFDPPGHGQATRWGGLYANGLSHLFRQGPHRQVQITDALTHHDMACGLLRYDSVLVIGVAGLFPEDSCIVITADDAISLINSPTTVGIGLTVVDST